VNLGNLLSELGKYPEAVSELREAIRLDPGAAKAHYNLGVILFKSGDVKGDVDEQLEALRLEPKYALAHSEIAWVYATEAEARNPMEALKHAQIAVELNQWKSPGIIENAG
jgi:tetratricopeptide (TPR) repeat protein